MIASLAFAEQVSGIAKGLSPVVTPVPPERALVVTVGSGTTVTVTATNTFLAGAIHVDKVREGPGAALYGAGPFTVTLTCLRLVDGIPAPVDIPGGADRTLSDSDGYAADYLLLPADATCVLRETGTGGATEAALLDADGDPAGTVTVVPGDTVSLTAVNTFDVGSITVTKTLTGGGAADASGPFTVHLVCTATVDGMPAPVAIPDGPDRTLARPGLTATYENLPTGAQMLEMALAFEATQDFRFKSAVRLQNGGQNLSFVQDDDDATLQRMQLFEKFSIGIPVFRNGDAYRVDARLRYRVRDAKLAFTYELTRFDKVLEAAASDVITAIREKTGNPFFFGDPFAG